MRERLTPVSDKQTYSQPDRNRERGATLIECSHNPAQPHDFFEAKVLPEALPCSA